MVVFIHAMQLDSRGKLKPKPKKYKGPGNLIHLDGGPNDLVALTHKCLRGKEKHTAQKNLGQALDLVSWLSDPGQLIFDPFAGRGTIGLACEVLGRQYIGCEIDADEVAKAALRPTDKDKQAVTRWSNDHVSKSNM